MDEPVDFYLAASLFVALVAVVLASLYLKLKPREGRDQAAGAEQEQDQGVDGGEGEQHEEEKEEVKAWPETEAKEKTGLREGEKESPKQTERIPVEEIGFGAAEEQEGEEEAEIRTVPAEKQSPPQGVTVSSKTEEEEEEDEESKEETHEPEIAKDTTEDVANDAEENRFSFKYSPGNLRGSQYEKMMTKEELEEEQRVQRAQLAAILHLMKEKQETFGEMTESDMKEQLRLYNMVAARPGPPAPGL